MSKELRPLAFPYLQMLCIDLCHGTHLDRQGADVQGEAVSNLKSLCKAVAAPESRISALLKPGLEHMSS